MRILVYGNIKLTNLTHHELMELEPIQIKLRNQIDLLITILK